MNDVPTLFDMTLDQLRDEAECLEHLQGSISADDMWLKYSWYWEGLNSWEKSQFFSGDKRFHFAGYKRSIQPKANGRKIQFYRTLD
jgi:hypothetical protein